MSKLEQKESVFGPRGVELPEGIKRQDLVDNWDLAKREYAPIRKKMGLLNALDSGKLWERLCKKFPQYQIAPDTNHVNYVKENILASIYTVGKGASVIPKHPDDKMFTDDVNKVMDTIWDVLDVPSYQQKAGERAALLNLGVTQVGWNQDIRGGTHHSWYKGDVVFKNVDPMNYFRDPFSNNLEDASFVIQFEDHNVETLKGIEMYKEAMKYYEKYENNSPKAVTTDELNRDTHSNSPGDSKKYARLVIHWIKVAKKGGSGYAIHEIHTINNDFILHVNEDIKINMFPFAELYCNEPGNDLVGVSEPDKIASSSIVVNILDGIMATHAYKAQRPPRLINPGSGLNMREFAKYGNDPDKVFIVNGDPKLAVQYVQFPPLPSGILDQVARLDGNIKSMSGIDERYTGKDTGSILTTGGIEAMLAQSTMRDTTKINLYEKYTKDLSRLVLKHLIIHGDKREYIYKEPYTSQFQSIEMDFPDVDDSIQLQYAIHISNHLPKNKMRMAASADAIIEKSMQYQDPTGQTPDLMTPEEWLEYQEFPQKDVILERMRQERLMNKEDEIIETLTMFTGLLSQGMDPEQALEATVQGAMMQEFEGGAGLGSVGNEASMEDGFQNRQAG